MTGFVWGTPDVVDYSKVKRGSNYTQLMHIVDWYPTFMEAAGIKFDDTGIDYPFDGVSQWKGIMGNVTSTGYYKTDFRDTVYYGLSTTPYLKYDAMQFAGYKLINTSGGGPSGWSPRPKDTVPFGMSYEEMMAEYEDPGDGLDGDTKWLLFNIEKDPTERHEISGNNTNLVWAMSQAMEKIKEDRVPQNVADPNCPKQTFLKDPNVGNVYHPWCEGY